MRTYYLVATVEPGSGWSAEWMMPNILKMYQNIVFYHDFED